MQKHTLSVETMSYSTIVCDFCGPRIPQDNVCPSSPWDIEGPPQTKHSFMEHRKQEPQKINSLELVWDVNWHQSFPDHLASLLQQGPQSKLNRRIEICSSDSLDVIQDLCRPAVACDWQLCDDDYGFGKAEEYGIVSVMLDISRSDWWNQRGSKYLPIIWARRPRILLPASVIASLWVSRRAFLTRLAYAVIWGNESSQG